MTLVLFPFLLFFLSLFFFFFNDTATTEIYTLSLHDALPILTDPISRRLLQFWPAANFTPSRSEEHTSELQSQFHLVCRLLLEKKKTNGIIRVLIGKKVIAYSQKDDSAVH